MAVPTHVYSDSNGSTAAVTPIAPASGTILAGDVALFCLDTNSGEAITVPTPGTGWTTWTQVTGSPVDLLGGSASGGTRATVYWARATQTNPTMPTSSDAGDHQNYAFTVYRGCAATGNPYDVTQASTEDVADGSGSATGSTTTVAECLIVLVATGDSPDAASTTQFSAWACTNAASPTERVDRWTAAGGGGGVGVATATMAAAGAFGPFTYTRAATTSRKAHLIIALKPEPAATPVSRTWAETYDIIAAVSRTWAETYDILGAVPVSRTWAETYDVVASVSRTWAESYDVQAAVNRTWAEAYDVHAAVAREWAETYDIFASAVPVSRTWAESYDIHAAVARSWAETYDLRAAVSRTWAETYDVSAGVARAWVLAYDLGEIAGVLIDCRLHDVRHRLYSPGLAPADSIIRDARTGRACRVADAAQYPDFVVIDPQTRRMFLLADLL